MWYLTLTCKRHNLSFKQILKKKMDNLEKKVIDPFVNEPNAKVQVLLGSISDLQKQLNDFNVVVEDYKQNLDLMEHLQQMMKEVLVTWHPHCACNNDPEQG